jgi:chromosome segregation ATPase
MVFIAGTIFIGCQSSDQKVESAQDKLQNAAEDLDKVQNDAKAEKQKAENAEEWKLFKAESEVKINNNDSCITALRVKMKKSGKKLDEVYEKRIGELEEQNTKLKVKIDTYEKNHSDWEAFKLEFNHDMDGLGKALKEFTVTKKK